MYIPFCPLPTRRAKTAAKRLFGAADRLSRLFPKLDTELKQSGMELSKREYIGIVLFSSIFVFFVTFLSITTASIFVVPPVKALLIGLLASFVLSMMTFIYLKMYPKMLVKKNVVQIEKNLLHTLRHIYVQVKSGVTIYDAIVSASNGNYGKTSEELRKAVKYINTGMSMEAAFEKISDENPSVRFRRSLWHLSNGLKAGSDIGTVLKSIIDNTVQEQKVEIKRYGSQLNPLTLVYMMLAVIIPSLGITFLIILSSFSGMPVTEKMFLAILGGLALFQFMFIGIIKSRRPNL